MSIVTVFETHPEEYDRWFDAHDEIYQAELGALRKCVPQKIGMGIEVGVGTGRFAVPLGIPFGLDPSRAMLQVARHRGLWVCQARGEWMPFRDEQFELILLVTVICFVDDVPTLLRELHRVLKPGGHLIIGFISRDSELGQRYEQRKHTSLFYQGARFHAVEAVANWVTATGFIALRFYQTLLGHPENVAKEYLEVHAGWSRGALVVLGAKKQ